MWHIGDLIRLHFLSNEFANHALHELQAVGRVFLDDTLPMNDLDRRQPSSIKELAGSHQKFAVRQMVKHLLACRRGICLMACSDVDKHVFETRSILERLNARDKSLRLRLA